MSKISINLSKYPIITTYSCIKLNKHDEWGGGGRWKQQAAKYQVYCFSVECLPISWSRDPVKPVIVCLIVYLIPPLSISHTYKNSIKKVCNCLFCSLGLLLIFPSFSTTTLIHAVLLCFMISFQSGIDEKQWLQARTTSRMIEFVFFDFVFFCILHQVS